MSSSYPSDIHGRPQRERVIYPISTSPSAMASLCLAVLAFLPTFRFLPFGPSSPGSPTGVAAPDGLLLPSSK
jgi:hypothetical protein